MKKKAIILTPEKKETPEAFTRRMVSICNQNSGGSNQVTVKVTVKATINGVNLECEQGLTPDHLLQIYTAQVAAETQQRRRYVVDAPTTGRRAR